MNLKEIYALVDYLVEERLNQVDLPKGIKGSRGPRGFDGQDFSWDESKSKIVQYIKENSLTFEKLTEEQVKSLIGDIGPRGLKGSKGERGIPGDNFDWENHREEILSRIDSNKLSFSDFTDDEVQTLKGPRGYRGQKGTSGKSGSPGLDGNSFNWDSHLEDVLKLINSNKLKFSDFTTEEISKISGRDGLKGPKGISGKDGIDGSSFSWNDHENKIFERIDFNKLKFSDLTEDEQFSLKGERGSRGQRGKAGNDGLSSYDTWLKENDGSEKDYLKSLIGKGGVPGIQGIQGAPGVSGRMGLDGNDGEDAPVIIDIQLREDRGTFYFIFYFDNGSQVETRSIDKPVIESIIQNTVMYAGGGSSTGGASVLEVYKDSILIGLSESLNFAGDNISVSYDEETKQSTISVTEPDPTCIDVLDEGTFATTCLKSMNFVGEGVTIENITTISDWDTLTEVTSMANYLVEDTGHIVVNVPQQEITAKLGLTRIATGAISKFDLIRLVSSTNVSKGSSDTSVESKISGIALNTAADGEPVDFVMFGIIEDASFTFALSAKLFLQSDGSLGTTPPSTTGDFVVASGESLGIGAIFIKIQEPEGIV